MKSKFTNVFNKDYLFNQFLMENNMDLNIKRTAFNYIAAKDYFKQKFEATIGMDDFFTR